MTRTAKMSMYGIAIVSMLHGYSVQRRTIGLFSATAGLLVLFCLADHYFTIQHSGSFTFFTSVNRA